MLYHNGCMIKIVTWTIGRCFKSNTKSVGIAPPNLWCLIIATSSCYGSFGFLTIQRLPPKPGSKFRTSHAKLSIPRSLFPKSQGSKRLRKVFRKKTEKSNKSMEVHLHFWAGEAWTKKLQILVFINFFFGQNFLANQHHLRRLSPQIPKKTHPKRYDKKKKTPRRIRIRRNWWLHIALLKNSITR